MTSSMMPHGDTPPSERLVGQKDVTAASGLLAQGSGRGSWQRLLVFVLSCLSAAVLAVLYIPAVQREIVFMHHVNWPFGNLSEPMLFGLPPGKTRNVELRTGDGERIGLWHILPRSVYTSLGEPPLIARPSEDEFDKALADRPVVLFFHGNAANRAVPYRIRIYTALSNQLDCNVLVMDYRGFGDSTGTPSEDGLVEDARTAYEFVVSRLGHAGPIRHIILAGHSLGTGVISQLAARLVAEGRSEWIRAMVLISPFTSLDDIMIGYRGIRLFKGTWIERDSCVNTKKYSTHCLDYLKSRLQTHLDSLTALQSTRHLPTLIMHARNDWTIPITHARKLYTLLASLSLGSSPGKTSSNTWIEDHQAEASGISLFESIDDQLSGTTSYYPNWGWLHEVPSASESDESRESEGKISARLMYWEGERGGHNDLGWTESGLDLVAQIASLR